MLSVLTKIVAPVAALLLLMMGNGFFMSFVTLHLRTLGFEGWVIGLVHSGYYAGLLIGAWRADRTIVRVGHIRAYAAFCAIGTACLLVQALTNDIWVWGIARFVMGFCVAVYFVVVESWFLGEATDKTRGTILSVYMVALYLSQALSQHILPMLDLSGVQPFIFAGLFGVLSQVPLTLTSSPAPHVHEGSRHTLGSLFRRSVFGFSGCVVAGIILSSIYSFLPMFASSVGVSVSGLVSTCILGGVLLQFPVGKLSDIIDRRAVLLGVSLATVFPALAVVFFHDQDWLIYVHTFLLGGLTFTLYPLSITQVCDRLQTHDITRATGVLLLAYGLGAVAGPLLAPICLRFDSLTGLYVFISLAAGVLTLIGCWAVASKASVPAEDQSDFVPLPSAATPVAYDLDPRAPDIED